MCNTPVLGHLPSLEELDNQTRQKKKVFTGRAGPASFKDLPSGRNTLSDDKKARAVKDPYKEARARSDGRGGPCSAGCS